MNRLIAALLSFAWAAFFAFAAWGMMLVTEDGIHAAAAVFGLMALPPELAELASRPVAGALCLGAAVVAALFVTAFVSTALNREDHVGQGRFLAEMGFGGALGITGLMAATLFAQSAAVPAMWLMATAAALIGSLLAVRAALGGDRMPEEISRPAARMLALEAAAAHLAGSHANVVRFPIERTAGVRP